MQHPTYPGHLHYFHCFPCHARPFLTHCRSPTLSHVPPRPHILHTAALFPPAAASRGLHSPFASPPSLPCPLPSTCAALLQPRAEQAETAAQLAQQQLAEARSEVSALQQRTAADAAAIAALSTQLAEVTELHGAVSERLEVSQAEAEERLSSLRAKDEVLDTLRGEITNQV